MVQQQRQTGVSIRVGEEKCAAIKPLAGPILRPKSRNLPASKLPPFSESRLKDSLMVAHTLSLMWIDDSSADVIKADFEALYHGDMLVEGETSEQFEDWHPLPTAS
jgi:hypothetical protein